MEGWRGEGRGGGGRKEWGGKGECASLALGGMDATEHTLSNIQLLLYQYCL